MTDGPFKVGHFFFPGGGAYVNRFIYLFTLILITGCDGNRTVQEIEACQKVCTNGMKSYSSSYGPNNGCVCMTPLEMKGLR